MSLPQHQEYIDQRNVGVSGRAVLASLGEEIFAGPIGGAVGAIELVVAMSVLSKTLGEGKGGKSLRYLLERLGRTKRAQDVDSQAALRRVMGGSSSEADRALVSQWIADEAERDEKIAVLVRELAGAEAEAPQAEAPEGEAREGKAPQAEAPDADSESFAEAVAHEEIRRRLGSLAAEQDVARRMAGLEQLTHEPALSDVDRVRARAMLAAVYEDTGRIDQALELRRLVAEDSSNVLGPKHPESRNALAELERLISIQDDPSKAVGEPILDTAGLPDGQTVPDSSASAPSQATDLPGPEPEAGPLEPTDVVATVTADVVTGPDVLNRSGDARAIAGLIASRALEPPLAIGLFGEWGSGKTHFMHQISASIKELSQKQAVELGEPVAFGEPSKAPRPAFHRNVVQVWFNAWHYAEHNLWASLLQHVWTSLQDVPSRPEKVLADALAQVEGAQQVRQAAEAQASAATEAVTTAQSKLDAARKSHDDAAAEAAKVRARDVLDLLTTDDDPALVKARGEFTQAATELGLTEDLESARGLMAAVGEVRRLGSRAYALSVTKPWYRSPLAVGLLVAVLIGIAGVAAGAILQAASRGWLANVVTATSQLAALVSGAAAWLTRRVAVGRRLLAPAERLQVAADERVAKLEAERRAEVERLQERTSVAKAEHEAAAAGLAQAQRHEAQAKTELSELTGAKLLRRYLAERAGSNDYQRYMGLVALAHRDLTDLAAHLAKAAKDAERGQGDEADQAVQRIVLYIDDLDRCSPETVARVLEAVHLLLALPLFVAVVGVDRRWLDSALSKSHPALLGRDGSVETSPRDYLDKIFHLTYTLPAMTAAGAADLLASGRRQVGGDGHAPGSTDPNHDGDPRTTNLDGANSDGANSDGANSDGAGSDGAGSDGAAGGAMGTGAALGATSAQEGGRLAQAVPLRQIHLARALELNEGDAETLRLLAPLVYTSPRRVNRFSSAYRVIRARAMADPEHGALLRDVATERDAVAGLAALVALIFGVPVTAQLLIDGAFEDSNMSLGQWLSHAKTPIPPSDKTRIGEFLFDESTQRRNPIADRRLFELRQWLPFTLPYCSFALPEKNGAAAVARSQSRDSAESAG